MSASLHAAAGTRAVGSSGPRRCRTRCLRELRGQLIRGDLQPGDRIRADLVAADLGVSVIPVREALRVLLAESRVELEPHRGYRVTVLSPEQIDEIFLICRLLEGEALRRGVSAMDAAADARMLRAAGRARGGADGSGVRRRRCWPLVTAHQDFHFVPMECAGLPRLVSELRRLWDHTDHYRRCTCSRRVGVRADEREHRAICEACLARDADEAVRAERPPPRSTCSARMGVA